MGNKSPAVPPPILTWIQITVLTLGGGPVTNVEIEVWGLYLKKTGPHNQLKFSVSEEDYDNIIAVRGNTIDVKVRKHHFGPPDPGSDHTCTPGESHKVFNVTKGIVNQLDPMILQDAGLNRFTDKFEGIPARNLTMLQARNALLCLHREGEITLIPEPTFKHTEVDTCDSACTLGHPMINELVQIKPLMAGSVEIRYIDRLPNFDSFLPGIERDKVKTRKLSLMALDPRYTVAVYRLVKMLKDKHSIVKLYHLGMSGFKPQPPRVNDDCHSQGRALDFGGVGLEDIGLGDQDIFVVYDWGNMPVYDEHDLTLPPAERRRSKGFLWTSAKDPSNQRPMPSYIWPTKKMKLPYRLETLPPHGNPKAAEIFQDVYTFATEQFQDAAGGPSKIGQSSAIMNPDHFTSDPGEDPQHPKPHVHGREAHRDHMHIQIGSTGAEPVLPPVAG